MRKPRASTRKGRLEERRDLMAYLCQRCGKWFNSTSETPPECKVCTSPYWDTPRR